MYVACMPKKVTINAIRKGGSTLKFACSPKGNGPIHEYTRFVQNLCGLHFVDDNNITACMRPQSET